MSDQWPSNGREVPNNGSSENEVPPPNVAFESIMRPFFRVERFENGPVNLRWGIADDRPPHQATSDNADSSADSLSSPQEGHHGGSLGNSGPNPVNSEQVSQERPRPIANALESLLELYRSRPGGIHDLINEDDFDQLVRNLHDTTQSGGSTQLDAVNEPSNERAPDDNFGNSNLASDTQNDTSASPNRPRVSTTGGNVGNEGSDPDTHGPNVTPSHNRVLRSIVYYFAYQDAPYKTSSAALEKLTQVPLAEIAANECDCMICYEPLTEIKPKMSTAGPSTNPRDENDSSEISHDKEQPSGEKEHKKLRDEDHSPLKMPCGHIFGASCLKSWLRNAVTCPLCRTPIEEHAQRNSFRWAGLPTGEPLHPDAPWSGLWRFRGNRVLPNDLASSSVTDVNEQRRSGLNNWMDRLRPLEDPEQRVQRPTMAELRRQQSQLMNDEAARFRERFIPGTQVTQSNQTQAEGSTNTTSSSTTSSHTPSAFNVSDILSTATSLADSRSEEHNHPQRTHLSGREAMNTLGSFFDQFHSASNGRTGANIPTEENSSSTPNPTENLATENPLDIAVDRLRQEAGDPSGQNQNSRGGHFAFAFGPHTLVSVVLGSPGSDATSSNDPGDSTTVVNSNDNNADNSNDLSEPELRGDSSERNGPSRRATDRSHPYNRNTRLRE